MRWNSGVKGFSVRDTSPAASCFLSVTLECLCIRVCNRVSCGFHTLVRKNVHAALAEHPELIRVRVHQGYHTFWVDAPR